MDVRHFHFGMLILWLINAQGSTINKGSSGLLRNKQIEELIGFEDKRPLCSSLIYLDLFGLICALMCLCMRLHRTHSMGQQTSEWRSDKFLD